MKKLKKLMFLAVVACVFSSCAESMTINAGDKWGWDFCTQDTHWSPKKIPASDDTCSNGSYILNAPSSGDAVFNGKSFTVGSNRLCFLAPAPSSLTFANDGLFLASGSPLQVRSATPLRCIIKGKLTLNGDTATTPASICGGQATSAASTDECVLQVDSELHGQTGTQLLVTRYNQNNAGPCAVEFMGDASDFHGTVTADAYRDRVRTGCAVFSGTIQLKKTALYGTVAPVGGQTAVSKLVTLDADSTIEVAAGNVLKVTDLEMKGSTIVIQHSQASGAGCLVVDGSLTYTGSSGSATLVANVGLDSEGAPQAYEVMKVPTSFVPIDKLGITWDKTGTTQYAVRTNDGWQVLTAQNSNLNIEIPGGETKTMKDLSINGGSIRIGFDGSTHQTGCAEFTGDFNLNGKLTVSVEQISTGATGDGITGLQPRCVVLKAPADRLDPADVTLTWSAVSYAEASNTGYLPESYSEVCTNDGQVLFVVGYRPVVKRVKWEGGQTADEKRSGLIEDGRYWSDGLAPHGDADYIYPYLSSASGGPLVMDFTGMTFEDDTYVFGGRSLTMGVNCQLPTGLGEFVVKGDVTLLLARNNFALTGFCFADGVERDGVKVQTLTASRIRPYPVGAANKDFYYSWSGFGAANTGVNVINAPIECSNEESGLSLYNNTTQGAEGAPTFKLAADNSAYRGRMAVHYTSTSYRPTPTRFMRVQFDNPQALGGSPSAFVFNSLILTDWARLMPTASMTLATPNRGIYVRGRAGVEVPQDVTFTLGERLTMGGELEKLGPGLLALGSNLAPRFGLETVSSRPPYGDVTVVDVPSAGTNVLRITEGALVVKDKNSAKGLSVKFEGGAILVDPNAEEGSFARDYGGLYMNDDYGEVSVSDNGKILVVFDKTGKKEGDRLEATVCTVRNGTALTPQHFKLVKPWSHYGMTVTSRPGQDAGTVTFVATASPRGVVLVVR